MPPPQRIAFLEVGLRVIPLYVKILPVLCPRGAVPLKPHGAFVPAANREDFGGWGSSWIYSWRQAKAQGSSGAYKYMTNRNHYLEGSKTIANGGIGGSHPYLAGVIIPSYVGATDPNNDSWVDTVLNLVDLTDNPPETDPVPGAPATPTGLRID